MKEVHRQIIQLLDRVEACTQERKALLGTMQRALEDKPAPLARDSSSSSVESDIGAESPLERVPSRRTLKSAMASNKSRPQTSDGVQSVSYNFGLTSVSSVGPKPSPSPRGDMRVRSRGDSMSIRTLGSNKRFLDTK